MRMKSPFTAIVSGPTGAGKSKLLQRLIEHASEVSVPAPEEIIYCYGVWQPLFDEIKGVTFHEGFIDVRENIPNDRHHRWLIIDDLMDENNGQADGLYTKLSHHMNISVFFVVQNFFKKQQRTMSLNTHYLFLFKNPRDSAFISHLARQMYPSNSRFLVESYQDATKKPYSYLMLDMKQNTDDRVRVIGNYFSEIETMCAYSPK